MRLDLQPPRPVPKPHKRHCNRRKKKKLETFKGVKIPSRKVRGNISKKEYEKAMEHYGYGCAVTKSNYVEMHHVVFRSQGGRGTWRNLVPLSPKFHKKCHTDRNFADFWRKKHREKFGEYFYCDKYDLFKKGLIKNCTDEEFERFMLQEEENERLKSQNKGD